MGCFPAVLRRNSTESMQLHGERTRLACRRDRLDHDFKTQTFLSLFGAERMVVGSIRRDAEYHTPEARAPHFHCIVPAQSSNGKPISKSANCEQFEAHRSFQPRRFRNLRYSRLGSLRYFGFASLVDRNAFLVQLFSSSLNAAKFFPLRPGFSFPDGICRTSPYSDFDAIS